MKCVIAHVDRSMHHFDLLGPRRFSHTSAFGLIIFCVHINAGT